MPQLTNRIVLISILLLISFFEIEAQRTFPTDVTANGGGYGGVAGPKDATANTNPASLAHTSGIQIAAAVRNRFLVEGLYDYGLFGSFELGSAGTLGIQVEHFSFETFRQQTFAGAFGRQLSDQWFIGIKINYLNILQSEQENASGIYSSMGLLYKINDQFALGADVSISSKSNDGLRLPVAQKIGFSYSPSGVRV